MSTSDTPRSSPLARVREGLAAGLVLGLADMLATGPWRVPPTLVLVVVATALVGGIVAGLLALPLRRAGAAAALALVGAVALQGASLVTKELGGSPVFLVLVLVLAIATGALAVVTAAGGRGAGAALLALVGVPAGSLFASVAGFGALACVVGLMLPLVLLLVSAARPPRAIAWIGTALAATLPLPVLFLDPEPQAYVETSPLGSAPPADAPDVLMIVIDTLRADAIDWTPGNAYTPNLAALAALGVRFDQAIASASWTLPSMSSLFTGLLPSQHGAVDRLHALPDEATTMAERFRAQGYRTIALTGGAFVDPGYGLAQGFEHFDPRAEYWFRPLRVHVPLAWRVVKNRYVPQRWILRRVHEFGGFGALRARLRPRLDELEQAGRADDRPVLLCLHSYQVHDYYLYQADPDDAVRERLGEPPPSVGARLTVHPDELFGLDAEALRWFEAIYRARLALVDRELGRVIEEVRARRGERELIIALTSDHGEGFDAASGRVHHGGRLHDDLLRIPLVLTVNPPRAKGAASHPTVLTAGRVVAEQVRQVDIAPTLLELAGLEPLPDAAGASLVKALDGGAPFPERAWAEEHMTGPRWRALRAPPWKLLEGPAGKQRFDVMRDPAEAGALPFEGVPELERLWISFDERYPARVRARARLDPSVQHQLDHIGYGD